jgi:hypothetical protein
MTRALLTCARRSPPFPAVVAHHVGLAVTAGELALVGHNAAATDRRGAGWAEPAALSAHRDHRCSSGL